MNAASLLLEVLNVPVAVTASSAKIPAQPLQAFKDSLAVACQAALDANTNVVLAKPPLSKPTVADLPEPVVAQPVSAPGSTAVPPVQQPSLAQIVIAQVKTVPAAQTVPVFPPPALLVATKPTVGRTPVTSPRSRPLSHPSEASSTLTPTAQAPTSLPNQGIAAVALPVPQLSAFVNVPLSPVADNTSVTPASSPINVVPIPVPEKVASFAVDAVPVPASAINIAASSAQPAPAPKPSSPDTVASPPVNVVASPQQPRAVAVNQPSAPALAAPVADAAATLAPLPSAAPNVPHPAGIEPRSVAAPLIETATVAKPVLATLSKAVLESTPPVTNVAKNAPPPVVLRTDAPLPPAPAPAVHDAGTPRETTSKTSAVPTIPVDPPAATPSPATAVPSPAAPADPLVASFQLPLVTVAATPPAVLTANSKDVGVKAVSDAAGGKQHAPAIANQTASQAGSAATPQPGDQTQSQGQGQSQGGPAQPGQSTPPVPANLVNHTVAASAQSAAVAVPLQNATPLAAPAGHAAKTPEPPAPTVSALPQPLPVVNTAKLIQTAGQSEMRVGMRSNDFGNISISTSSTRDSISAQISLDHSELAKTLATHVPEMQARLGGNQVMDVRIDMNGQATGQASANSSGMSNASSDGSRGDHTPRGNAGPAQQDEKLSVTATAAILPAEAALNSRLDIRA